MMRLMVQMRMVKLLLLRLRLRLVMLEVVVVLLLLEVVLGRVIRGLVIAVRCGRHMLIRVAGRRRGQR